MQLDVTVCQVTFCSSIIQLISKHSLASWQWHDRAAIVQLQGAGSTNTNRNEYSLCGLSYLCTCNGSLGNTIALINTFSEILIGCMMSLTAVPLLFRSAVNLYLHHSLADWGVSTSLEVQDLYSAVRRIRASLTHLVFVIWLAVSLTTSISCRRWTYQRRKKRLWC